MADKIATATRRPDAAIDEARGSISEHIDQNVLSVASLHERELETLSPARRRMELISAMIARPGYLLGLVGFVMLWAAANLLVRLMGIAAWDPPPFELLQGLLTFLALLTTTVILIAQLHQTRLEQQRAHLDLQVNLLTEQKVTKLIRLVEELRRDLPMVKDRHDPVAESLQEAADARQVLDALEDVGLTDRGGRS
jgi:uncharacterized membrane protein